MGDLGSAAVRGKSGGSAVLGEPVAGSVCGTAEERAGDGVEPDAVGVPAVDAVRAGGDPGGGAEITVCDLRRRSTGVGESVAVDGAIRRQPAEDDQHVRD